MSKKAPLPLVVAGIAVGCLLVAGVSGCCNYCTRTEGEIAPYACAPHPYYCTAEVWPDVALTRKYYCPTAAGLAIETWPISVVDEMCEVVFDTFFLPADLVWLLAPFYIDR